MHANTMIALLAVAKYSFEATPKDIETVPPNFTHTHLLGTTEIQERATSTPMSTTLRQTTRKSGDIDELLGKDERPWWYQDALKDVAYYLRAHKFNEYDRRYNRDGTNVARTNFMFFPKPPLRSLHWEVHKYCEPSFLHCVDYLRKKLKYVALRRQDDTSVVAQENKWESNSSKISQIDMECRRMRKVDSEVAPPFEGPLERYQWRATASYFMCWYTMNEVADLKHLGERCDNFAYCLDMSTGPNNDDIRADDNQPFACAQYSFCPDPCCPIKYLPRKEFCWKNEQNPCFQENPEGQRECQFKRTENIDFSDLLLNRLNVTCKCSQKGFVWSSLYGICIDIDECASSELHTCKSEGQACMNLVGSYTCVCKWGYFYDEKQKKCALSDTVSKIKLNSKPKDESNNTKARWEAFMKATMRFLGKSSSCQDINWRFAPLIFVIILIITIT